MIELKLLNIFYNFDQKFYSSFILKELTKISEFNNYELILYPENYSFNQFSNVKKILENIKDAISLHIEDRFQSCLIVNGHCDRLANS
jgi:DNA polymerase II large subunit